MKSDTIYRIQLVEQFKNASNSDTCNDAPKRDHRYDPFHHRVTPVETFVNRIAQIARDQGSDARIESERSGFTGPQIAKTLLLRVNEQTFSVEDAWTAALPTPSSTHRENCLFLESAQHGVAAFAGAIVNHLPTLSDDVVRELGMLEKRLRANCHDILRRAERKGKAVRARAKRSGLTAVADCRTP